MKKLLIALALITPAAHAEQPIRDPFEYCQYGVILAQKAYLSGTYDAQSVDYKHLNYLVDYWGDSINVPADRAVAKRSVRYIADRMKSSGLRAFNPLIVTEPVQETLINECGKYYVKE